jgi:hypothetical protein
VPLENCGRINLISIVTTGANRIQVGLRFHLAALLPIYVQLYSLTNDICELDKDPTAEEIASNCKWYAVGNVNVRYRVYPLEPLLKPLALVL